MSRRPKLDVRVPITHEVQERDGLAWVTRHEGSERSCADVLAKARRWHPDKEIRMLAAAEALADRRRKTWSVRDVDHIPTGTRVMLAATPSQMHPRMEHVVKVLGMTRAGHDARFGVVKSRHRRYGSYMVEAEGSGLLVSFERADLIFPIPENVVPMVRPRRRAR